MEIDYRKWEREGQIIDIGGRKIVVATEDLAKDDGCELWTFDEAKKISNDLAGGWRLPSQNEIICMIDLLKDEASYWAGFSPVIYRTKFNSFVTDDLRLVVACRIRCVSDLAAVLE